MKMGKPPKYYPLNQSPLYKLKSKKKLYQILGISPEHLKSIINGENNYSVFIVDKGSDKARKCEVPALHLKSIHKRVFYLLRRIEPPLYLHSGIKGRSYITNAETHIGNKMVANVDIRKFYPSTRGWHIFDFFNQVCQCSKDVSGILVKLATYDDHIPTGSCLSQIMAFYAHYKMFEELNTFALGNNVIMTVYVDDISFSGDNISRKMLYEINGILKKRALQPHPKKERLYKRGRPSEITGSIVTKDGLLLPNRKHKQIHDEIVEASKQKNPNERLKILKVALGRAVAACQSDASIKKRVSSLIQEKKHAERLLDNKYDLSENQISKSSSKR